MIKCRRTERGMWYNVEKLREECDETVQSLKLKLHTKIKDIAVSWFNSLGTSKNVRLRWVFL